VRDAKVLGRLGSSEAFFTWRPMTIHGREGGGVERVKVPVIFEVSEATPTCPLFFLFLRKSWFCVFLPASLSLLE
jgi:hypothetical protein